MTTKEIEGSDATALLNGHCTIPTSSDPWVSIPRESDFSDWDGEKRRQYIHSIRQPEIYKVFINAFDFINEMQLKGDYLEFGCHCARTFRMALTEARRYEIPPMRFYAFDSFEGLPAVEGNANPHWKTGSFAISEGAFMDIIKQHGIYVDKVTTIKGFYDKTLNM